jgi:predicted transcriptional regulator of viral defense system
MTSFVETIRSQIPRDFFTTSEISAMIPGTIDSKKALIRRSLAKGDIVRITKGVYLLGSRFKQNNVSLYEIARLIYSPSYISFESALSFHNMIPEAVTVVSSASFGRSNQFQTALAHFQYSRIPATPFLDGVARKSTGNGGAFLIATPEKAIIDLVYERKLRWTGLDFLLEGYRIDEHKLLSLSRPLLTQLSARFKGTEVSLFVSELVKELRNVRRHY